MFSNELEELISVALEDGVITAKERQILIKRAVAEGIDVDEFEMILDSRVAKLRPSTKKAEDVGSLKKCPFCGARLKATDVVCPECGHEISDKKAVLSARQLAEKLAAVRVKDEDYRGEARANVIKDFPIPTNAEDLLDFISSMAAKAKQEEDSDERAAYIAKYDESCSKAKVFFPNDERFKVAMKNAKMSRWNRLDGFVRGFIIFAIVFAVFVSLMVTCGD